MTKAYISDPELEVFNNQYLLQIGGRHNPTFFDHHRSPSAFGPFKPRHSKRRSLRNKVEKPFNGIISGLYFNLLMPLDLAATRDPRIKFDGDVVMYASQKVTGDSGNRVAEDEALATWNRVPNSVVQDDLTRKELKDRMMMSVRNKRLGKSLHQGGGETHSFRARLNLRHLQTSF